MRLDDELAALEGRFRAADFNPCPVAREHDAVRSSDCPSMKRIFDDDFVFAYVDRFVLMASLHIRVQRPAEQRHLRSGKGQDRPETQRGCGARDAERRDTNRAEEQQRAARAQRAMRSEIEMADGGWHGARLYQRICGLRQRLTRFFAISTAHGIGPRSEAPSTPAGTLPSGAFPK